MQVKARLNNLRVSPKKARLVVDLIRGLEVEKAQKQLAVLSKSVAKDILKLLNSTISNGENNFGLRKDNLFIKEVSVNEGNTIKRWSPRAFGRAGMIRKRNSKIDVVLDEKVPTPEDKIRKNSTAIKVKKITNPDGKISKKTDVLSSDKNKGAEASVKGQSGSKGFGKKMFQRKSGTS